MYNKEFGLKHDAEQPSAFLADGLSNAITNSNPYWRQDGHNLPVSKEDGAPDWSKPTGTLLDSLWMVWLAGAGIMLTRRIYSYQRFCFLVHSSSRLDTAPEAVEILDRCRWELGIPEEIELRRSPLVETPFIIGLRHPVVMLPERELGADQLVFIMKHELMHVKRRDLPVKWLTQLAVCLHWFNPAVHLAARRIERLCELACDEAVIRGMGRDEKQRYGETLIAAASFSAGQPAELLGAMSRKGNELKERLVSIMKSGKRKNSALIAALLLVCTAFAALYMGYLRPHTRNTSTYDFAHFKIQQIQLGERYTDLDQFQLNDVEGKTTSGSSETNQIIADGVTLKIGSDGRIIAIRGDVYDNGFKLPYYRINGTELSTYRVVTGMSEVEDLLGWGVVKWYDRGQGLKFARYEDTANHIAISFVYASSDDRLVWVDSQYTSGTPAVRSLYPLSAMMTYKTPYVGDASKVSQLAGRLPVPSEPFMHRFISLSTQAEPYGMAMYYEPADNTFGEALKSNGIPPDDPNTRFGRIMRTNALVLFSMVDNLGQVTFSYRTTASGNDLVKEAYPVSYTFHRKDFREYGDLAQLAKEPERLEELLLHWK